MKQRMLHLHLLLSLAALVGFQCNPAPAPSHLAASQGASELQFAEYLTQKYGNAEDFNKLWGSTFCFTGFTNISDWTEVCRSVTNSSASGAPGPHPANITIAWDPSLPWAEFFSTALENSTSIQISAFDTAPCQAFLAGNKSGISSPAKRYNLTFYLGTPISPGAEKDDALVVLCDSYVCDVFSERSYKNQTSSGYLWNALPASQNASLAGAGADLAARWRAGNNFGGGCSSGFGGGGLQGGFNSGFNNGGFNQGLGGGIGGFGGVGGTCQCVSQFGSAPCCFSQGGFNGGCGSPVGFGGGGFNQFGSGCVGFGACQGFQGR